MSLLEYSSPVRPSPSRPDPLEDAFHAWAEDPAEPDDVEVGPDRHIPLLELATDTIESLLLHVAHGDHDAFLTLQNRMSGLVLLNIRRVLRDATRSQTVTQESFADLLYDSLDFDPHRDDALTWLLTRAHQHATDRLHGTGTTTDPHDRTTDQPATLSPTH